MSKLVKYELSVEEANLIIQALAKLPYEVSEKLIRKLITEGNAQAMESAGLEKREEK